MPGEGGASSMDWLSIAGFLCGDCPDGEGVDLTLNQCKQCTVGDAVILAVIGGELQQ